MLRRDHFLTFVLVALGVFASLAFSGEAMAQANLSDPSGSYNGLLDLVQNSASQWDARLRGYAVTLFWLLASIQFIWTFFPLVFKQADFGEIVGELVRFILVIGFFAALLMYSSVWAGAIVDSFRDAGSAAAGAPRGFRPGDMFARAVEIAQIVGQAETWNPLSAAAIAIAACVVLLCFAFVAVFMGLTLIESYIVINASVLFMGFGGSQWTREYAIALMRYALSVGAKLFVLTLLVGLIVDSTRQWQAAYNHDDGSMWTMVGLALACAYFSKTLPDLVQGLITGSSASSGAAIGSMATAAAAGAAAAAATVATAGAAAPAAAGAAGAGGAGAGAGGAMGGAGGLAQALNGSIAAQSASAGGAAGSTASAGASGVGGMTGGSAAKAAAPRIGGGSAASGPSGPAPKASSTSSAGSGASGGGSTSGGNGAGNTARQAIKAADAAGNQGDDRRQAEPSSAPLPPSVPGTPPSQPSDGQGSMAAGKDEGQGGGLARAAASAAVRGSGILSAISVPGMEGAAGLSLGAAPPPPTGPGAGADDAPSMEVDGSENIIRPVETPSVPPVAPPPASSQPGPAPDAPATPDGEGKP